MASLNCVHLIGNLTRDPELRVTPKGTAICQFGLAINRSWKDESGQTREEVTFIDLEAWGKSGETIAKYCTKGKSLYVQGRLKLDSWDDKATQQKRTKLKVICENFQFLGGRDAGSDGSQTDAPSDTDQTRETTPPARRPASNPDDRHPHDIEDDQVPF